MIRWLFLIVLLSLPRVGFAQNVSIEAQDIPVRIALQLIAKEAGVNVALADSVTGSTSLSLRNVPWREALDVVVKTRGLTLQQQGNVLWVAPANAAAPLDDAGFVTRIFPVQYHSAAAIFKGISESRGAGSLNSTDANSSGAFLSARGRIFADERNNALVVSDTPDKIIQLESLIKALDVPAQQVIIEARIVVANDRFAKEIGAKFGLSRATQNFALSGNLATNAENLADRSKLQSGLMSALSLTNPSGSIAGTLLTAGNLLDVELQAMQTNGLGQIISQPRIITTNQRTARIAQGREVGYVTLQNHSNANPTPNVAFKQALLELSVTPTITQDGHVFLALELKKDELDGYVQTSVGDIPQINKREVTTAVLMEDGQTLVIGGVQEFIDQDDVNKVPYLGDIPLLKHLFRKSHQVKQKAELLIFLTPTILKGVAKLNDNAKANAQ